MMVPATNACLKLLRKENIVTGRKAKTEKGQPIITPLAETATAKAGFSRRANADASDIAYIENELGKKPENTVSKLQNTLRRGKNLSFVKFW